MTVEKSHLLRALEICGVEDFRLNGCACNERGRCYYHAHIVAPLLNGKVPDQWLRQEQAAATLEGSSS